MTGSTADLIRQKKTFGSLNKGHLKSSSQRSKERKRMKKNKKSLKDVWTTSSRAIHITGIPEGKERERGRVYLREKWLKTSQL